MTTFNQFCSLTCQNKRANGGDEAGKERVEGECAHKRHINKLENTCQHDVNEEKIDNLQALRCAARIFAPELMEYLNELRKHGETIFARARLPSSSALSAR